MENGKFTDVIVQFEEYLIVKKGVSDSTRAAYKTDLKKFSQFLNDKYDIKSFSDLNQSILMSYVLHLKSIGRASSSINRSISVLKNFTLFCYLEGVTSENLSESKLEIIKDKKKLPEVLTVEEVNIMLSLPDESILGLRDKAMLETLYTSGLKVNELIQLTLADVNLKLKVLTCQSKNKKRVLPLGAIAYDAIVEYLVSARSLLNKDNCENLFLSYNGSGISRQGFWKIVKKYAESAGINKNISTSTFRHSFATHMIENGIKKDVLTEALGNTSVASVQVYLDLNRKRNQL